jgi:hypothetical protein
MKYAASTKYKHIVRSKNRHSNKKIEGFAEFEILSTYIDVEPI